MGEKGKKKPAGHVWWPLEAVGAARPGAPPAQSLSVVPMPQFLRPHQEEWFPDTGIIS